MTGTEYYQDILETIDESEVDAMISQLRDVARNHNISPYKMLVHLVQLKEQEEQSYQQEEYGR